MCRQALTFFGLTSAYRVNLFKQIHQIVFHGKGGYTWTEVYNMPIWLRKFTFLEIKEFYDTEQKNYNSGKDSQSPKIARPDIKPTYSSKSSKK